ncbi:UNVERIFIED_CONTAM: hypothetical protein RMT77_019069 [Armadillidium vulgare]
MKFYISFLYYKKYIYFSEHPEYYNISVPNSKLYYKKNYYNGKDICLAYFDKISAADCVSDLKSTFIICEYA